MNIFERDWDFLVVLDTACVDTLRTAAETKDWIGHVDSMQSVGSMSAEWVLQTFTHEYLDLIERTALVSGNGWSRNILRDRYHEQENNDFNYLHAGTPSWDTVSEENLQYHEIVILD